MFPGIDGVLGPSSRHSQFYCSSVDLRIFHVDILNFFGTYHLEPVEVYWMGVLSQLSVDMGWVVLVGVSKALLWAVMFCAIFSLSAVDPFSVFLQSDRLMTCMT